MKQQRKTITTNREREKEPWLISKNKKMQILFENKIYGLGWFGERKGKKDIENITYYFRLYN